ncbi:single-stranded DNA-binding protein [Microbacterium betulae]|uniref:Single-stranded DNA-binding protein n=1 Tax=Microbacterium betulae TaxID=2981139 RepID=A0AA97I8J1_9MICO|nr:single-stranded DNA-binding protein [Microbacterium sp. AB]WOF24555.1 single-stranded DNA-binding protein [Microbacterium sp. AB]
MTDHITVVGNIANDPTPTTLPNGTAVLRFRLASNRRRFDREKEQWVEEAPNWYSVAAFRSLATNGAASLSKGQRVVVSGRLRVRPWQSDSGARGTEVEIAADALGIDLLFGTTTYSRTAAGAAYEPRRDDEAEPAGDDDEEQKTAEDEALSWHPAKLGETEPTPF